MKILVPMDGSESALRALEQAIRRVSGSNGEIRLLNVQLPIPSSVSDFVGSGSVQDYYREEGEKALDAARERLTGAGVPHDADMRVGAIAETIATDATEQGCDEIVMGSRGLGTLSSMLLGSVASRVLHLAKVPVTIVK